MPVRSGFTAICPFAGRLEAAVSTAIIATEILEVWQLRIDVLANMGTDLRDLIMIRPRNEKKPQRLCHIQERLPLTNLGV
jgi:hypothetical protein